MILSSPSPGDGRPSEEWDEQRAKGLQVFPPEEEKMLSAGHCTVLGF
jgi:hypothetical protein